MDCLTAAMKAKKKRIQRLFNIIKKCKSNDQFTKAKANFMYEEGLAKKKVDEYINVLVNVELTKEQLEIVGVEGPDPKKKEKEKVAPKEKETEDDPFN